MNSPLANPYKDIDFSELPEPSHETPLWKFREGIQEDVFQVMYRSGLDVITSAHRIVGMVLGMGKILLAVSLLASIGALFSMIVSPPGGWAG